MVCCNSDHAPVLALAHPVLQPGELHHAHPAVVRGHRKRLQLPLLLGPGGRREQHGRFSPAHHRAELPADACPLRVCKEFRDQTLADACPLRVFWRTRFLGLFILSFFAIFLNSQLRVCRCKGLIPKFLRVRMKRAHLRKLQVTPL